MDKPMSATDIFKFDVEQARLRYLQEKRTRHEELLPTIDAPKKALALFDDELPAFLRPQAD